jgi:imidazolonepropionase-like amidohydrolase
MARHLFSNANLLDGNNAGRSGATVVVENEHIVAVASGAERVEPRQDDLVYDLGGRTLMPGMVSGHFHSTFHNLGAELGAPTVEHPPAFSAYRALANAQLALRHGFTGVVSAGCAYDIDASLAKAIDAGLVEGPRMVPCGPDTLSSTDGVMPWWLGMTARSGVDNCDGPDELRKAVRRNVQRGARLFKMTASGGHGVLVPAGCRVFSFEEIRAAVEAAHDLGIRVRAHVAGKPFILECIRAGVDILDHCDGMDEECIEAMVKAGVFVLPSLYQPLKLVEMPPMFGFSTEETKKEFDWMCRMLPKAVAAGVKLCSGDDFGTALAPHGEYGRELAVYVDHAGIAPLEVLRWATRNGAALMGRAAELGAIEAGRLADLIIVDADPSRDIGVLSDSKNIRAVMKGGRFVSGTALTPRGAPAYGAASRPLAAA